MEQEKSSSDRGGQEVAPEIGSEGNGRLVNGAFFSEEELDEFSRQDFLEPFSAMEKAAMPRVDAVKFITRYLPIMMDERAEDDKESGAWLNMWRTEISLNIRLSVVLTGERGEEEYVIPPPFGTIHTGNTGHPDSIEGRFAYMATHARRLHSAHRAIKARLFNAIQVETEQNREHQDDLLRLLADSGYLARMAPELADHYRTKTGTSVTRYLERTTGGAPVTAPTAAGVTQTAAPIAQSSDGPQESLNGSGGGMDYD